MYRRGLICRADDRGDPVIQFSPPLIAGPEQFEEIEAVLRPVLEEASRRMLPRGEADADRPRGPGRRRLALLAGEGHLDMPVRWVHISELADPTPWLSGASSAHHRHRARQPQGASASTSPRWPITGWRARARAPASRTTRCPKALLEAARERDFPLFEVPYELPFIALTEHAFTRLVNEQYALLQRSIAAQERLQRIVLSERGLDAIVGRPGHADRRAGARLRRARRAAGGAHVPARARSRAGGRGGRRGCASARAAATGAVSYPRIPSWPRAAWRCPSAAATSPSARSRRRGSSPPRTPTAWPRSIA
jgi:hypothetical protein